MLFHWREVYAALRGQASLAGGRVDVQETLNAVFGDARELVPGVFAGEGLPTEPQLQARFGVCVPLLAAAVAVTPEEGARQALVEGFIARLDVGLREAGIGDMGVGRRVRAFAGALNGRLKRYVPLLVARDREGLESALIDHDVAGRDALLEALMPAGMGKKGEKAVAYRVSVG